MMNSRSCRLRCKVTTLRIDEFTDLSQYKEVISLLKKGYAIRNVAKLTGKGISTIQRIKKDFY